MNVNVHAITIRLALGEDRLYVAMEKYDVNGTALDLEPKEAETGSEASQLSGGTDLDASASVSMSPRMDSLASDPTTEINAVEETPQDSDSNATVQSSSPSEGGEATGDGSSTIDQTQDSQPIEPSEGTLPIPTTNRSVPNRSRNHPSPQRISARPRIPSRRPPKKTARSGKNPSRPPRDLACAFQVE